MSRIYDNVASLHKRYGNKIKSEKHLILLFWKDVDGLAITKQSIPTAEFINLATSPIKIISAYNMYKIVKEEEING